MNPIRLIFSYYIVKEDIYNVIYKYHLTLLKEFGHLFDHIDIYLCIDDINNIDIINVVKTFILSYLNEYSNKINFSIQQNDHFYREGKTYYNQLLLRLNEYSSNNEIVMFGHTKGLTNNDLDNSINWICLIYYFCLQQFWQAKYYLTDNSFDKICYGPLYYYSLRNMSKYKWMYVGGFSIVNTNRLLNYINNNNLQLFNYSKEQNIRICAEEYLPNIVPIDYVSFFNFQNYNLYNDLIKYENGFIWYYDVLYVASLLMPPDIYLEFCEFKQNICNKIN